MSNRREAGASEPALDGHDVVAYFTSRAATVGLAEFSHVWNDAEWRFANATNRDAFAAEPERFAPQFGGDCAVGHATGVSVPGSPQQWRIDDDKLFLNKNAIADSVYPLLARRIRKLSR